MEKIIEKVCSIDLKRSLVQVTFIKTLVKMMLNSKIYKIRFSETLIKRKIWY